MKRSSCLSVATVLGALLVSGAATAGTVNLISNGGFDEGLAGWNPAAGHRLVTGGGEAHSGESCLAGEVTGPGQALVLRRRVTVRAGNRYRFGIWARATGGTKLVLWVERPGSEGRKMAASWTRVPRRWREYTTPLLVTRDGALELQIVAPSSHAAPPGRIWIDDVVLEETAMPELLPVSRGVGFNDEPAMAAANSGDLYVAWNSFRDGADSLQLARFQPRGAEIRPAGAWQLLGGKGTSILGVCAVSAGERVMILHAAEKSGNWEIHAVPCGPDGPGRPVQVTSHGGVDVKPAGAWQGNSLWVAWESNRGGARQIFAVELRDGRVSGPVPVSSPAASSYDPSIAILESGAVCVAWHSFREDNYDVYLRRRETSGAWGPEKRLTRATTVDRHARLLARRDELWLLYENAGTDEYHVTRTNRRRLVVARVAPQGLLAPKSRGHSPLEERCEAADARFDSAGRLWLTCLRPRLPRAGWDVHLTGFTGGHWQAAVPVSNRKGMDRRPTLSISGGRAIVAFQADTIPNSWSDVDRTLEATSDIFLAAVELEPSGGETAAIPLEPLVESDEVFEAAELRQARGEETPTPTIRYRGQTLKLFFGDLHEHTDISVCNRVGDQSPNESYQHMRDIAALDFACATDHGYNINPYLWGHTAKLARTNDDPDRFLTFLAEEWTSSFEKYDAGHPYGYYGHRNLIFADLRFPRWWNARNGQTPAQVWEELRRLKANFVHIPHQLADTGNVPTDWDFTDETAQPVAEIFQTRGSYEYHGAPRQARRSTSEAGYFLQDAWARGIVIGVIASPDHGGGYGKACVYAPELTREAILDALRARSCYGTTAARIFLDVRVNGHLMGEKIAATASGAVKVEIRARCPGDIESIEVCRNNRFIYTRHPGGREADLELIDREPLKGRSYYYVRVIQKDGEIAWSSPVWFGTP